ncbi:MAG: SGNH/GDSL hydrolase family protein, partial [Rhodoglobus sp.]
MAAAAAAAVLALAACSTVVEPETAGSRDPSATRVAFYGDSYTLGTGASDPALRWSTIVCAERDWSEFNPSVNGLGFINNRGTFGDGDLPSLVIADR